MHLPHETVVLTLDEAQRLIVALRKASKLLTPDEHDLKNRLEEDTNRAQVLANAISDRGF